MPKFELSDHQLVTSQVEVQRKGKLPGMDKDTRVEYRCEVCGQSWKEQPTSRCPGARVYAWDPWPKGLLTRKQLAAKKLNPGPLAGVIPYDKSADGDGWLRLYREDEATPKPPLSAKRQAALAKAQAAAEAARLCQVCGRHLYGRDELYARICWSCERKVMIEADQIESARVAHDLVCGAEFVVWDSETTDLGGKFVEIAVVDAYGKVLLDQRVRPQCLVVQGAYEVHGIRDEELVTCPTFPEIWPDLREALHLRPWVIYNAQFDTGILYNESNYSSYRYHFAARPIEAMEIFCAMNLFASWYGEWHDYYKNYRWQKLSAAAATFGVEVSAAAHSALGDCLRTLGVLYGMADWYRRECL